MDFGLSDEQRLLQDTVEQFLAKENDATQLRARFDADEAFDPTFWRGIAELGLAVSWEALAGELADVVHAHPTLSESIRETALAAAGHPFHTHG